MKSIKELKAEICKRVERIEDEKLLLLVEETLVNYGNTGNKKEGTDTGLTSKQQQRLKKSIQQADAGNTISNEEVKQLSRTWLAR